MSRRYLVTGAQGLIGRYLTARILRVDPEAQVVGIGRSSPNDGFFTHTISGADGSRPAPVPKELIPWERYRYERLALQDGPRLRGLIRAFRPHCIFHLASALHTAAERDLVETNVEGTAALVDAIGPAHPAEALLVVGSSGSVYGGDAPVPIRESDPCNPAELYGATKLAAEQIVRIGAARSGFAFVTARIFNVVGPGQSETHVCARLAAQLATPGQRTLHVGPLAPTRDFIDVRDVAAALLLLTQRGERGGTYNLASGRETSIGTVLAELLQVSRARDVEIVRHSDHPAGVSRHVADISRLKGVGFIPAWSLRESLAHLFAYHLALHRAAQPSSTCGAASA